MADQIAQAILNVVWDGASPATAPAGSTLVLTLGRNAAAGVEITGSGTWTILLEASFDGVTWFAPTCTNIDNSGATATLTAAGRRKVDCGAAVALRARMSAHTSGNPVVTLTATSVGMGVGSMSSGAVTVADGANTVEGSTTDAAVTGDNAGTISAKLRGLNKVIFDVWDSVNHWLSVKVAAALPAGSAIIGNTGGITATPTATFTRPADTTAYTAGDSIANSTSAPVPLTFANAALATSKSGFIHSVHVLDEANQTTKLQATLYLFTASPTATNDNAALAISNADLANLLPGGAVSFTTADVTNAASGASGNVVLPGTLNNPVPFKLGSGTSLFGLLQANNAYTPTSGEIFIISLGISQDS